ncbi:transglycosylase SLT domain-containing protein [Halobacillus litoralis]|nr:transglycosylase SLT domain-containing protein [Halobacillus litoralis]
MGSGDVPGNVKSWISQAIAKTGVPSSWLGALTTIAMKESGGRTGPSTINKWDSNWRRGTPSMGLMQTIRPTFNAYKETGWNDIMNPVHNAAAAINYIKSRYGNVMNVPGIRGLRNGTGYVGYKTGARISTPGLYGFAEDGWPEYAISTNPARRTDSMKLLALAGKEIQGNKRPNQLPTPGNGGFSEASLQVIIEKLEKQVANTEEMVQLLMKLLLKDPNFVVDGRSLAVAAKPHLDDMQTLNRERGDEFA